MAFPINGSQFRSCYNVTSATHAIPIGGDNLGVELALASIDGRLLWPQRKQHRPGVLILDRDSASAGRSYKQQWRQVRRYTKTGLRAKSGYRTLYSPVHLYRRWDMCTLHTTPGRSVTMQQRPFGITLLRSFFALFFFGPLSLSLSLSNGDSPETALCGNQRREVWDISTLVFISFFLCPVKTHQLLFHAVIQIRSYNQSNFTILPTCSREGWHKLCLTDPYFLKYKKFNILESSLFGWPALICCLISRFMNVAHLQERQVSNFKVKSSRTPDVYWDTDNLTYTSSDKIKHQHQQQQQQQ